MIDTPKPPINENPETTTTPKDVGHITQRRLDEILAQIEPDENENDEQY